MKKLFAAYVWATVLGAAAVVWGDEPSRLPIAQHQKFATQAKKALVIEFFADWCAPCKVFEKEVLPAPAVVDMLRRVHFVRYDAGADFGKQVAAGLHVRGYPTFVALRHNGEQAGMLEGAPTQAEFLRWIAQVAPDAETEEALFERLKRDPTDAEAMLLLGFRAQKRGEFDAAAGHFERVLRLHNAHPAIASQADWALRKLRLAWLLPRQELLARVALFPDTDETDVALLALLRKGSFPTDKEAHRVLSIYLDHALKKQKPEQLNRLVYRLLRARAFEAAERVARHLLGLEPTSPLYLDTLAEVQHLRGNRKEALRLSDQALSAARALGDKQLRENLQRNRQRFQSTDKKPPQETAEDDVEPWPWETSQLGPKSRPGIENLHS